MKNPSWIKFQRKVLYPRTWRTKSSLSLRISSRASFEPTPILNYKNKMRGRMRGGGFVKESVFECVGEMCAVIN
jgi:hypothetical protein